MKTSQYLDLIQKKEKLLNDNQLRLKMNWSKSKVNNYRHNRQGMDNEAARQTAEILNMPVLTIIADMEAMRAKDQEVKKRWKELAKMSQEKGLASVKLLTALSLSTLAMSIFYILCKIVKLQHIKPKMA